MGALISWQWCGRQSFAEGTARQRALRDRLLAGDERAATVLLLEHDPVITLGRRGDDRHVLASRDVLAAQGIEVVRASRGGDVTYHGPGQLMIYPVVRIAGSVVAFLEAMASALAELAARLGVPGARWQRDPAGLWLGPAKLAACGVHLRRRVTCHGFAFNLSTPPEMWQLIVPCGLGDRTVTSIAGERRAHDRPSPPPMAEVAAMAGPLLCAALEPVTETPGV